MMNGIHLQFSPGSEFYGYQVRVPFTCKFAPGLFGLPLGKFSHKLSIITIFAKILSKKFINKFVIFQQKKSSMDFDVGSYLESNC